MRSDKNAHAQMSRACAQTSIFGGKRSWSRHMLSLGRTTAIDRACLSPREDGIEASVSPSKNAGENVPRFSFGGPRLPRPTNWREETRPIETDLKVDRKTRKNNVVIMYPSCNEINTLKMHLFEVPTLKKNWFTHLIKAFCLWNWLLCEQRKIFWEDEVKWLIGKVGH